MRIEAFEKMSSGRVMVFKMSVNKMMPTPTQGSQVTIHCTTTPKKFSVSPIASGENRLIVAFRFKISILF